MKGPAVLVITSLAVSVAISNRKTTINDTSSMQSAVTAKIPFVSSKSALRTRAPHTPKQASRFPCDRYYCNCHGQNTHCSGFTRRYKLTHLPRVPAETRALRIDFADLRSLTRSMLANVANFDIEELDLDNCNISHLDSDAFTDFVKLVTLALRGNPIPATDLQQAFWSTSKVLTRVHLDKMGLTDLPDDFFAAFRNTKFSTVDLQNNSLTVLDSSLFAQFLRVDKVDVSRNKISELKFSKQANVTDLRLNWSLLLSVPDFCLQGNKQNTEEGREEETVNAFINLQSLYLRNGIFKRLPTFRGQCLPDLDKLDISGAAALTSLHNNFIAGLPVLHALVINDMPALRFYPPYSFNSSSLRKLNLERNEKISARKRQRYVEVDQLFRHCPNLEDLSIVKTKVDLNYEQLRKLLQEVTSLKKLRLESIYYWEFPEDLLWRLPRLQILVYTGNGLTSGGLERALINVTTLEELNVQGNKITVVSENTLPWEFRRNAKRIDLGENPFECTCELLWFRKWLDDVTRNKSIDVLYPSRCRAPEAMRNKPLADFHPTDESCATRNPYIVMGIAIGCLVAMGTVAGGLCYRYRWHLRFYIYSLRRRTHYKHGCVDDVGEVIPMHAYDVYLAHSADDLDWIVEELLPLLEEERGLKVFLEERNTKGGTRGDNIPRYMDDSARVMLVVSDNYNREGWRQYEFEHILYAAFEQHKDVIVLLLGDVEAGSMTRDMRRMLTRGTFLQWGPGEDAKRSFRNGLEVALRTQDVSLIQALC